MTPADVAAVLSLVDKGGVVAVLIAVVLSLTAASRWLLTMVLKAKDDAIAYRDEQITALRGQIVRQQDLHQQAMDTLERMRMTAEERAGRRR